MAGVTVLFISGVLTTEQAFSGFSNAGTITVAMLFIVARGLAKSGAASWIASSLLGKPTNISFAQLRLLIPVATLSSVVNNTPVVAIMIPAVMEWAKRFKLPVSQLLMPLSYAAIIGGACTLIGTSTNLVVDSMLQDHYAHDQQQMLGLFELAWLGVPCVIVTVIYVVLTSRYLLPRETKIKNSTFDDVRQYTVEMLVESDSPLVGKSIESAGLRNLPGMYLIEIDRKGHLITAVGPKQVLQADDRLVFVGNVESVVDLQNMRGLRPADDQIFKVEAERSRRHLVEVVISNSFPQLGKTVKEGRFRTTYGAAIIAIAREGQHLKGRIGDIVLKAGDTLLIEAGRSFERQQRYVRDFLMVRRIDEYTPISHERMPVALAIFITMVIAAASGILTMLQASMLAVGALIVTRCLEAHEARRSIDWQILIIIAASIALGEAMVVSGVATTLAEIFIGSIGTSPYAITAGFFFITAAFSALISNVAAAVLLFPIAAATSEQLGLNLTPMAVTLMFAASASFSTPIGYQTNLMVYGPGRYKFMDFVKMGVPLTILVGIVTVILVPLIWPF